MTEPAPAQAAQNKLLGLEAIRFVCALGVLFWHYQHFAFVADQAVGFERDTQPLYGLFKPFYDFGYFGVTIFWCISGFIFFWKYQQAIASGAVGARKFFVLRFSRLYPLHLATLLSVALLQAIQHGLTGRYFVFQKNDAMHFVLQLFMASNWASTTSAGDSFNGPIWSISVEVLIYSIFFLVLRHVGRSALINVAIVCACLVAKFAKVPSPIVDCLAFFYVGGLSAIALRHFQRTRFHGAVMMTALCAIVGVPGAVWATGIHRNPHFTFLFLISYTPVTLYFCAQQFRVNDVVQKFVEAAGNMTYSSYLVHFPIQLATVMLFEAAGVAVPYHDLGCFFAFFGATLLASYGIYRFFEMPAQTLIRNRLH